jgi:DNA-binding transcriptional regulator GbsR (MarR family)
MNDPIKNATDDATKDASREAGSIPGSELSGIDRRFVLHWGEMGSRWGVNRTVSQIHALIYLRERPMHAEEIADTLSVARSNVSNSLRELQNWNLVRVVHQLGDRRDHYETLRDPWELFRTIVRERKMREFDPTIQVLRECLADPDFSAQSPPTKARIRETLALMDALSAWSDEMLRLDTSTLTKLLKLGARVRSVVRGKTSSRSAARTAAR